jgi:hypothetical protein
MSKVMPGLGDLRLISRDRAANLGAFLLQCLDDKRLFHAFINPT